MKRLLEKIVEVKPDELRALWLGFFFNFVVLGGYYVIRPIRDNIGAERGIEELPWMYTGTLVAMLIANMLFSAIVARMSRRRFIPIAYRFFIANLIIFYLLMQTIPTTQQTWLARSFFVWVSVFNLFVVSVFWQFMTDVFNNEQGKRLFGFISIGGALGGIFGPTITASLVQRIGVANLILISAAMLEIAAQCVRFFPADFESEDSRQRLSRATGAAPVASDRQARGPSARTGETPVFQDRAEKRPAEKAIGGSMWAGITHILRSPYLFVLFLFIICYTVTSTWAYFQQSDLARFQIQDSGLRTAFLARLDLSVNTLELLGLIFLTSRFMKWFGVGITLALMPALSMVGFITIGFLPLLSVLALFQVLRRATTFAITRPAREVLFTVLPREDKYKAKSVIDTFAYRVGDQIGAWSYRGMHAAGLGLSAISFIAVPVIAVWCGLCLWLGKKQSALARVQPKEVAA
jgi:AAA family ATP:ADP antiporter